MLSVKKDIAGLIKEVNGKLVKCQIKDSKDIR